MEVVGKSSLVSPCQRMHSIGCIPTFYKASQNVPSPFLINFAITSQCRSKGNISGGGGARERRRREALEGCGGMLPQKILQSRGLEMLFPAFSKSYF